MHNHTGCWDVRTMISLHSCSFGDGGKVFWFFIADASGGAIRCVAFDALAEQYAKVIRLGDIYRVNGAAVGPKFQVGSGTSRFAHGA